jgi:hypothetical protein
MLMAVLLASGCGGALGGDKGLEPTPTSKVAAVPTFGDGVPPEVPTVYIPPVGTVYTNVPPVPSKPAHLDPTPTDSVSDAKGDKPETDAIVQKWKDTYRNIHTISGKQEIMRVNLDGTIAPVPADEYSSLLSTEETWVSTDRRNNLDKFRFKAYTRQGYMLAVFDGSGDYVTWSAVPGEVYRLLPESKIRTDYSNDDNIIDKSFTSVLWPQNITYTLVGRSILNGHTVIELKPAPAPDLAYQYARMHVYLDEGNYLPYRYIEETLGKYAGWQLTIVDMKVNEPVSDSDLKEGVPDPKDVVTIFRPGPKSTPLPSYTSLRDPNLNAGFNLFESSNGISGAINTIAIIEQNGVRTPLLSFNGSDGNPGNTIVEGVHLPAIKSRGWPFSDNVQEAEGTPIDVGGLLGRLLTDEGGGVRIRFQRDGTWIQVGASTRDEAVQIAESLQPVNQTTNDMK